MAKMQTEITVKPLHEGSADIRQIFIDLILHKHSKSLSPKRGRASDNTFDVHRKSLENRQYFDYNIDNKVFSCVRVD